MPHLPTGKEKVKGEDYSFRQKLRECKREIEIEREKEKIGIELESLSIG